MVNFMYKTVSQDMFDYIAYKTLGDCNYTGQLFDANIKLIQTFQFKAGIEINIPEIDNSSDNSNLPPWRR